MKKVLFLLFIGILCFVQLSYAWTWTKSWDSSSDGSAFGGSDIQNIQNDVANQALSVSGSPAQGGVMYYSGSSWTALAAGTSGQFLKTQGAGANPTWASGGKVVQIVNTQSGAMATGTTAIANDDNIPQNTAGDQYMTLAITPTSATSTLSIDVVWNGANSTGTMETAALFQDTTANALACASLWPTSTDTRLNIKFSHYMTSGTTSSTTFKVRAGATTGATTTFNGQEGARRSGGVIASSITITEYSG